MQNRSDTVKKTRQERRAHAILFAVLGIIIFFGLGFKPILRQVFPVKHMAPISEAATRNDLEPLFVAAVVKVESGFDPRALSSKGARGLMQVMPDTGAWVAGQLKISPYDGDTLYDPETNLLIGSWYLRELHDAFDGNVVAALAAYNAGMTRVRQWLEEGRWDGTEETLDDVPFEETRTYVRRVLTTKDIFDWLYGHRW